jgi:hypothetical protein
MGSHAANQTQKEGQISETVADDAGERLMREILRFLLARSTTP